MNAEDRCPMIAVRMCIPTVIADQCPLGREILVIKVPSGLDINHLRELAMAPGNIHA